MQTVTVAVSFIRAVWLMRKYQRAYFASRHDADLNAAKAYERSVDKQLAQIVEVLEKLKRWSATK
jgi:phosphoribosylformimino-5-aminoimidazole carboxamide ribonucleotide (ProFAR) isomerase